ncbi:MAG TPA: type I secretion C-terminal target domain-containing protein, partial [Hyphomicrobiaceae bacterium]|nr:type I secretion C-terminal target domain-containing protein [Hyphomicrobiaceae bacterium]
KGDKRDNLLVGGDGNDHLRGMAGADTLTGGDGKDVFQWMAKDIVFEGSHLGVDTITDFSVKDGDVLDLSKVIDGSPEQVGDVVHLTETKEGTMVSVKIGDSFADVVFLQDAHGLSVNELAHDGLLLV